MNAPNNPHSGTAFFDALFSGCDGLVELRTLPPGGGTLNGRAFLAPQDDDALTHFVGTHLNDHLYFGTATRCTETNGTLENCAQLPALFVDLDFKHTPEATSRQRLAECPFAASAIVSSGGGLHAYWFLKEPLDLQDPTDRARAVSLLRRLAHFLDADLQAAEPARVLRVPGSSNFKYDPPRQVFVERLEAEHRYNLSEFNELLPPLPVETRPNGAFVAPERILDGARNATLYKLARSLKTKGLDPDSIRAALAVENRKKCDPKLPDDEVDQLVAHASTQPDREAFLRKGTPAPPREREEDNVATASTPAPFQIVTPPTSFISTYIDHAAQRTDAPLEAHEALAFGILSALAGPTVRLPIATQIRGWGLALWVLYLVNSTSGRKSTVLDLALDVVKEILGETALIHWEGSPQGLLQRLQTRDGQTAVFTRDEYAGLLAGMNRGGHLAGLPQLLIKGFDGSVLENVRTRKRGADGEKHSDTDRVEDPYLVQLAAAPWDAFSVRATLDNVLDGFLPRFIIVTGSAAGRELPMLTDAMRLTRTALLAQAQAYHARAKAVQQVVIAKGVLARQWALEQEYLRRASVSPRPEAAGPALKRLADTALKLAALLAIEGDTGTVLSIRDEHFLVAAQITDRWTVNALRLIQALGRTTFQRDCEAVLASVQGRPAGLPVSTLYRLHRHLRERDFKEILSALEIQEQIVIEKSETGRGRPPMMVRPGRAT